MRETAGKLNRTWLALLGIIALLLGLLGILLASGAAAGIVAALGLGFQPADPEEPVLPDGSQTIFEPAAAALILTVLAAIVGLLALGWLLAQIPKRHQARTFRLHADDSTEGQTNCEPSVLAEAIEDDAEQLPGVTAANALLRGSASQPELNLDLKVDPKADVRTIIDQIHATVAPNLEAALETPLRKTAILVNVSARRGNDKAAVL